jgi:hypothetical protein
VFLYIAFLLVIYRYKRLSSKQYLLIDACLLLCVLTNATVVLLVPLTLLPYFTNLVKTRKLVINLPVVSASALTAISFLYLAAVYLRGIPKDPGYLDAPFKIQSILPFVDRNTLYAWTYPITSMLNSYFVAALLVLTGFVLYRVYKSNKTERLFIIVLLWTLFISIALLIINRSGLGDFFLTYNHKGGPDQFFYAQSMVVIFATGWLFKDRIRNLKLGGAAWLITGVAIYLSLAIPHGTSFGGSSVVYKDMKTIRPNLVKACKEYAHKPNAIVQIYPNTYWQWSLSYNTACKDFR